MGWQLLLPPTPTTTLIKPPYLLPLTTTTIKNVRRTRVSSAADGGESYLGMWKKAMERERKAADFIKLTRNIPPPDEEEVSLEKKSNEFQKILEVSKEERDRVQRIQVIDRAAAAIAAARSLLKQNSQSETINSDNDTQKESEEKKVEGEGEAKVVVVSEVDVNLVNVKPKLVGGTKGGKFETHQSNASGNEPPGPDFWSWIPPPNDDLDWLDAQRAPKTFDSGYPVNDIMEKERSPDILSIPFESKFSQNKEIKALPPFQSFLEVHEVETPSNSQESSALKEEIGVQFSTHAAEAADALHHLDEKPFYGVNPDGSRWWKETGVETRANGVVCRWTLNRGVTADGAVEWEEKYWEASDEFDHKELGSEKSGRDAMGNVWHEYWKESMWQEHGQLHMEKTADKWGKNEKGDEWQEKWFEHYDDSGQTEKWAHKWCSIDPNTEVDLGHAHVWNERWGEKYDGQGGSTKYTDKWAERYEGNGWVKWGDKWDENFDQNGHGVKQGETWWQGKYGEQWNRTWGEQHNGSGWVHKYGKSSSGEHWDTHAQEDTWYERYPHFGFMHCLVNSVHLREVPKPSESETEAS